MAHVFNKDVLVFEEEIAKLIAVRNRNLYGAQLLPVDEVVNLQTGHVSARIDSINSTLIAIKSDERTASFGLVTSSQCCTLSCPFDCRWTAERSFAAGQEMHRISHHLLLRLVASVLFISSAVAGLIPWAQDTFGARTVSVSPIDISCEISHIAVLIGWI